MADAKVTEKEQEIVSSNINLSRSKESHSGLRDDCQIDGEPEFSRQLDQVEVATKFAGKSRAVVVLILVGLPGSGKSTFCGKVMQNGTQRWTRICQDIISNGKRGSKKQCLKQARRALLQGHSNVLVDRCNLNKEQRYEFVQVARQTNVEVHALVLDLPVKLCIQRATQRTGHEGGLQGKTAAATIQRMLQRKELPSSSEGFSLITHCQSESDVENAVKFYLQLDGTSGPHTQIFKHTDRKEKGSLLPFLHCTASCPREKKQEARGGCEEDDMNIEESQKHVSSERQELGLREGENSTSSDYGYTGSTLTDEGARTLAFPPISTSDFQFDHEKAANVMIERISNFLENSEGLGLRLVLVDIKKDSDMVLRVRQKASAWGLDHKRFFTLAGDITRLYTGCALRCNFIANATNWRLRAGGGGVNAAVFKAAGAELEAETKRRAKTLSPGSALVVPLSEASPLRKTEGVTHVIHVLGPNMNPNRPNCLEGDYVQGCKILDNAYLSLFESFSSVVKHQRERNLQFNITSHNNSDSMVPDKSQVKPKNAFQLLMQASKRDNMSHNNQKMKHLRQGLDLEENRQTMLDMDCTAANINAGNFNNKRLRLYDKGTEETSRPCKPSELCVVDGTYGNKNLSTKADGNIYREHPEKGGNAEKSKASKVWGAWAQALRDIALHPEKHKDTILQVADDAVVIRDMYPKGMEHLLVVAKEDGLDSILDLQCCHVPLLEHMHNLGQTWARTLLKKDSSLVFRLGYHSDASMRQLHMHVISQDFDSSFLKNKKHWNSFTTNFFRDSKNVIEELRKTGKVRPCGDEQSLQKIELRCHKCRSAHPNLPRLKDHIRSCQVPYSLALIQQGYLTTATSADGHF